MLFFMQISAAVPEESIPGITTYVSYGAQCFLMEKRFSGPSIHICFQLIFFVSEINIIITDG